MAVVALRRWSDEMAVDSSPVACPRCGALSPAGSLFCGACGNPVAEVGSATAPPTTPGAPLASGATAGLGPPGEVPSRTLGGGPVFGSLADQSSTLTGLLLSAIGFALSWIPVVDIVGGLLVLIGWTYLFSGRRGYGPEHLRWVVRASALLFAGIVALVAATGLLTWLEFEATASGIGGSGTVGTSLANELVLLFLVVGVLGALGVLARVLLVRDLADGRTRLALWVGFALGVGVSAGSVVEALAVFTPTSQALSDQIAYSNGSDLLDLAGAVPAFLFAWAYYQIRQQRFAADPGV